MLPEDLVRIVFPTEILNKDEKCALLEAAHSGYAWLTHPMCVPFELKFIVRWHQHTVKVKCDPEAQPIREYSPIRGYPMKYSSIKLKPNRSLMLLGILCLNTEDVETKHEVIIKAVSEGVTWSKSVIAYSQRPNQGYKYLRFHEQHLEAGCEYVLKVENFGYECEEGEGFTSRRVLSPIIISPEQVCLEVTDNKANNCICRIGVRLA